MSTTTIYLSVAPFQGIGGDSVAVVVLAHKVPGQRPPILVHLRHVIVNVLRDHLGGLLGVLLVELGGFFLEIGLLREELALK